MSYGDIETRDKGGQWVNEFEGDRARSASFSSRDEAIEAARAITEELGTTHTIRESDPTGDITDPDR